LQLLTLLAGVPNGEILATVSFIGRWAWVTAIGDRHWTPHAQVDFWPFHLMRDRHQAAKAEERPNARDLLATVNSASDGRNTGKSEMYFWRLRFCNAVGAGVG
jgi:hypothetical protein